MVGSSLSTYLDVTRASQGGTGSYAADTDPVAVDQAARVLAAIHAGTELVTDLPEKTGLVPAQILALVGRLADAGLIVVEQQDGGTPFRVQLTEPTKTALSAA